MADFKLDGRMKVKSLKANFKKEFGASLRVYTTTNCKTLADDEKTLAALRAEGYKGGELVVGGNLRVGSFEKKLLNCTVLVCKLPIKMIKSWQITE